MAIETKTFKLKDFSVNEEGTFKAVFATMEVWDKDKDYTFKGAFGRQQVVISQFNHGSWEKGASALPIGIGNIYEEGNNAIISGEFDLDDNDAIKTHKKLKYLKSKGRNVEFSYSLPKIISETVTIDGITGRGLKSITVNEVSPVLLGAGINTRLLDIKSVEIKKAIPSHSTDTDTGRWDAGAARRNTRSGESKSYYNKIFAWVNPDGDSSVKTSYKFPHHYVDSDGTPGKASTRACSAGIAILNGARGGADIPDADRRGVYNHLAKHLRDADMEPPELKILDAKGSIMPLIDHMEKVNEDIKELIERIQKIKEIRENQKREFSPKSLKRVEPLKEELKELLSIIDTIQSKSADALKNSKDLYNQLLRYEQNRRNYVETN